MWNSIASRVTFWSMNRIMSDERLATGWDLDPGCRGDEEMEESGREHEWSRTIALVILTIITVLFLLDTVSGDVFDLENLVLIFCNFR